MDMPLEKYERIALTKSRSSIGPWRLRLSVVSLSISLVYLIFLYFDWPANGSSIPWFSNHDAAARHDMCPQAQPITPVLHSRLTNSLEEMYRTPAFEEAAYESLGRAIRIPTESFDDIGPIGQDPHWEKFLPFHAYLKERFPQVHRSLAFNLVNNTGLVYHWQGSEHGMKPILLAAHQDVVPVPSNTIDQWEHPPFSGTYDGEYIWGRGSCDDKSGLISLLTTAESLLSKGFQLRRIVVFAFGADEERGGRMTATLLAKYLLETYGEDGFALLVDEGGAFRETAGATFAFPSIAEKGKLDARLQISTPGGHSSVPPPHTGIGMLSKAISTLEENPPISHLVRESTYYKLLLCLASHAPELDPSLRKLYLESISSDAALRQIENLFASDPLFRAQIGTKQAVDIVQGGVKSNALPEETWAVVNHRISELSSVKETQDHWVKVLSPLAEQFNLSLAAFDRHNNTLTSSLSAGRMTLTDAYDTALEPAPVTPTVDSKIWDIFSGTIRGTIKSSSALNSTLPVFVAPSLGLGNTDTRHYWKLTRHIFRYDHLNAAALYNGAHTVNEAIRADGFLEMIRFHTLLILNFDEALVD